MIVCPIPALVFVGIILGACLFSSGALPSFKFLRKGAGFLVLVLFGVGGGNLDNEEEAARGGGGKDFVAVPPVCC